MSDHGSIIPITDEQAKLGTEVLKTLQGIGGFLREILGTVPEDLVGMLGGDWLKVKRGENIIRLIKKAHERLERDGVKPQEASLSVSIPLLRAAADESRDELQDLWASLLAAAADPDRSKYFRNEFIEVIKQMDPLDAVVFNGIIRDAAKHIDSGAKGAISKQLNISRDALDVSISHLTKLELLNQETLWHTINPFGREFSRTLKLIT